MSPTMLLFTSLKLRFKVELLTVFLISVIFYYADSTKKNYNKPFDLNEIKGFIVNS